MYLPPNPTLDPKLQQIVQRVPKTRVFDELWLRQQLEQVGYPDHVFGLQWLLMSGLLTIRGVSPAGHWQLARTTAPRPAFALPSLYVPALSYEALDSGGYYPALPPAVCQHLAHTHFPCYEGYFAETPSDTCTLAQMATLMNQPSAEDHYLRQVLDIAGSRAATYEKYLPNIAGSRAAKYEKYLPMVFFQNCNYLPAPHIPPIELNALTLSFDRYTDLNTAYELLARDLCLANYLLLVFHHPFKRQLTAVVRLPEGFMGIHALEALPAYCRQRFQARGCECRAGDVDVSFLLGVGQPAWLHPSLLRAAAATLPPEK